MSSVLIFGAGGFLGARLLARFEQINIEVGAARADIRDRDQIRAALESARPTHVINAAARGVNPQVNDERELNDVNVSGALNIQEECARAEVRRFLHLGSCFEYGSYEAPIEESFPLHPTTPYARSKARASNDLLERASRFKCETVILRLFGMWGPGEKPHRLVPQILEAARTGRPLPLSQGGQVRDWSYVDDMAADVASLALCEGLCSGDTVNVGSGVGVTVLEFANEVARVLGCVHLLRPGELPERAGEMACLVSSLKKLSGLVRPAPRTPIEFGVRVMRDHIGRW